MVEYILGLYILGKGANDSNIHILKKFEFNLIESIKDDSGQGVDTVYYAKGL